MSLNSQLNGVTRRGLIVAGFLGVALILGGGGSPSPLTETLVQITFAFAVLAWFLWTAAPEGTEAASSRPLIVLAGIVVVVPIAQMVPLPPAIWHGLPGRALEVQALNLVGAADSWAPLSISPYRTLASVLALVPPVGAMLAVSRLGVGDRRLIVAVFAVIAVSGSLIGGLQLASGNQGTFQLYEKTHRGWVTGFFANRNAAVDALLIGSLALTAILATRSRVRQTSNSAAAVFLMLQGTVLFAAVFTGSRTGIALIPIALLIQYFMLRGTQLNLGRIAAISGAISAAAVTVVLLFAGGTGRVATVAQRFDASRDVRADLWQDSWAALMAFWPAGSGVGTFSLAFLPYERLETLDPLFPNRAHNDYVEYVLETGVAGPFLLLAGGVALAVLARRLVQAKGEVRVQGMFALGALFIVMLHSVVDYPLRTMALATTAGVAAGLLAPPRRRSCVDEDRTGMQT